MWRWKLVHIFHDPGISSVSFFLEHMEKMDGRHKSFLINLLDSVLSHNYFMFNGTFYKQVSGTAMGAKCAPSYANLFLGWWEETLVYPLDLFQQHVTHWSRFIDDIVFIWSGSKQECLGFITVLDNNCFNIFLTATISDKAVDFLDLSLCLQDNRIITHLHRKKTATNSLLHYSSHHPKHLKRGIPVGQFLRVRRNCSDFGDFPSNSKDLTRRFADRGYPKRIISEAFHQAWEVIEGNCWVHG